jgi:hypothetical protein
VGLDCAAACGAAACERRVPRADYSGELVGRIAQPRLAGTTRACEALPAAPSGQPAERAIVLAYRAFHSFSTNLVGVFDGRLRKPGAAEAPWPTMGCAGGIPGD